MGAIGAEIRGTAEVIEACSDTIGDRFERTPDGSVAFEHDSYTEVYWDNQRMVRRQGETVFIDAGGEEIVASQLELVDDLDDPSPSETEPPGAGPEPDLDAPGRTTSLSHEVTRYEGVRPDGSGHSRHTSWDDAQAQTRPGDHVERVRYTAGGTPEYTAEGGGEEGAPASAGDRAERDADR